MLYGNKQTTVAIQKDDITDYDPDDPDYVETSYIDFFNDQQCKPIPIIPEKNNMIHRKQIATADPILLRGLIPKPSADLLDFADYTKLGGEEEVIALLDYEKLRKEILMAYYHTNIPASVGYQNILTNTDEVFQGSIKNLISYDWTPENKRVVINKILNTKTLKGFAGLMLKYCPDRCGAIINSVSNYLISCKNIDGEELDIDHRKEMLKALLSNMVDYSKFYTKLDHQCWVPLTGMHKLRDIIGSELDTIEQQHIGKRVLHRYRLSDKPNRQGHCNSNPYRYFMSKFNGYDKIICPHSNAFGCGCREIYDN